MQAKSLDLLKEPAVAPDLPSEILTRRPDVVAAEANLRAGHANLAAARAAMFPSLTLTGSAGGQNPALPATVLTIPGVGPSFALAANLDPAYFLDHGRQRASAGMKRRPESAVVPGGLSGRRGRSVGRRREGAITALQHLDAVREFEQGSVAESERAFEGARLRYQRGSGDFLTLLQSPRSVYAARDQFAQYKLARLQGLIALCKALGGGWSIGSAPQASPAPGRSGESAATS